MLAIRMRLVQGRTGQDMPQSPQRTLTNSVVVGVEKAAKRGVYRTIVGEMLAQQKCLKEPGGVSQVPFRRACVGHRLQAVVLHRKRSTQPHRGLTHRTELPCQSA